MSGDPARPARRRIRARDLFTEAALSLLAHAGRSALTAAGVVLGCAALVASMGLSATLSRQVSDSFDIGRATQVVVRRAGDTGGPGAGAVPLWQRPAALERLRRLNGVDAAGARMTLPERPLARTLPGGKPGARARIAGVDAGALAVVGPRLVRGRAFDAFRDRAGAPVVLLPAGLARALEIDRAGVAVFVDDRPFTVLGVFDDVAREPATLASVVMPFRTAQSLAGGSSAAPPERDVLARVRPGAARPIGNQAPLALLPEAAEGLESAAPPDPLTLRREVEGSVTALVLVASLIALAVGTFSIATAATAGIAARAAEIGLRRAVGARPGHVFVQLLAETTLLGAVGGIVGSAVGVVAVVAVALGNGWAPVLDLRTAVLAAAGGAVTGLVAGLLPGWRATRVQPVVALRR
ncbi:ABC transporter permease [Streptomyces sp. I6]|uniref:ABC transporter permease n=1 Tax=Streptomyces sp. I6 TaxID=2483113 RepID=UPI000F4533DE|nr:ABC transporter permease [Streptomyces sp. I6]RNL70062.1 FtsX-like permease family protein [Streptomyces sp. I6]